jgi:hypothetical protein
VDRSIVAPNVPAEDRLSPFDLEREHVDVLAAGGTFAPALGISITSEEAAS